MNCVGSNFLKYHYEKPDVVVPVYGMDIILNDHPVYRAGTIYLDDGKAVIVTQQHFNSESKQCWWGTVDPAVANAIYLNPNFSTFFKAIATEMPGCPIYRLRTLMWTLRMKPLKKEPWEDYFR